MPIIAQASALIRWPQQQQVPLGGYYHVDRDDGAGGDVDTRMTGRPIEAWAGGGGKRGFGLGPFGSGAWGFGVGGVGWGTGHFGVGEFGFDAEMHGFVTPALDDATYEVSVIAYDAADNPDAAPRIERAVTLAGVPAAPGIPTATDYDDGTDSLVIGYSLSRHDTT